jgi:putative effector of murein hydrolase
VEVTVRSDASFICVLVAIWTFAAYGIAYAAARRCHHPLMQPIFTGTGLMIAVLLASGLDFEAYRPVRDALSWPLGPATVALAVPIYNQRARLRVAALPLVCGVSIGCLTTIAAVLELAIVGRLESAVMGPLAVKSVTAPIAAELARMHGDDPSLAVVFVVITAAIGALVGPSVLNGCRIADPVARGTALGAISHSMGTAAALRESELAGALACLAMMGSSVFTVAISPIYVPWLLWTLSRVA